MLGHARLGDSVHPSARLAALRGDGAASFICFLSPDLLGALLLCPLIRGCKPVQRWSRTNEAGLYTAVRQVAESPPPPSSAAADVGAENRSNQRFLAAFYTSTVDPQTDAASVSFTMLDCI